MGSKKEFMNYWLVEGSTNIRQDNQGWWSDKKLI